MKRRKMIGSLVTLCFASLVLASCALESSPQATTQSELGEAESEELGSDAEREWIESRCLDSSEPEALDESALDTPAVLDGEIGTQDCLGDCRNARIADLTACQPLPPGFREECRAAAWVKYDKCVQICL